MQVTSTLSTLPNDCPSLAPPPPPSPCRQCKLYAAYVKWAKEEIKFANTLVSPLQEHGRNPNIAPRRPKTPSSLTSSWPLASCPTSLRRSIWNRGAVRDRDPNPDHTYPAARRAGGRHLSTAPVCLSFPGDHAVTHLPRTERIRTTLYG
jgi:hypothetical protein